jgi:hypothetical protein
MDSFHAIRAFLHGVRRRLRRRDALRALAVVATLLVGLALVGPLAAGWVPERGLLLLQRGLVVAAAAALVGAVGWGFVLPRRRFRRDADIARYVGVLAPAVASDLLSSVELERELERSPRFSRDLAVALANDTSLRLDLIDEQRLVPRGAVRRPALALVVAAGATAICWLSLPELVRAGWARLLAPPPAEEPASSAAPVAEPLVGDLKVVLRYPAYTRRPPLFLPASSGDILAPKGTEVALETTALRAAIGAKLVFDAGPGETGASERALTIDGHVLHANLTVDRPRRFRFMLTPPQGQPMIEAEAHRIEVEPDRAPRVELIAPADELDVSSRRRVELAYSVDDDYGISEIALVWRGNGKEERKVLPPPRPGARTAQAKFYWDLAEIALQPGIRIAYHLEAKDNDDVGGPNVGSSRTFYLRVFSPRERHEEVIERQQQLFEEAVATLATRLELGAEVDRRDSYGQLERLVLDLAGLLTLIDADTLAPKGLKAEVEGIHGRLEKLVRDEQPLLAGKKLADHDKKVVPELEHDTLLMDDWLSRQRMEELLAISDELKQHRARLHELLTQFERTKSPELRAEIEREMKAIEQRLAELQAKASKMAGEVADRFMNADAMEARDQGDCFAKVRELIARGELAAADKQLEKCGRQVDAQAEALEQALRGVRNDRFAEEEKAYGELMSEVADLERDQRSVASEAQELDDRYKKRAAEAARDRKNPQQEKARKTLERLRKETGEIPRDGLTPFAQEELDALKSREDDLGKMLDEGDVAEALALARHAEEELKTIGADVADNLADGRPWSSRTEEAGDKVARARPTAQQLIDELEQATPSPSEIMGPEDRQKSAELRKRQKALRERLERLMQKTQKRKDLPGTVQDAAQKGFGEAGEMMGRAEERFGAPDPLGARDQAEDAADKLGTMMKKDIPRAGRPTMVGQNGRNPDEEPVKIPGSEEYKPPETFREDILDAMKKGQAPDAYKDQVKRYYEELVK